MGASVVLYIMPLLASTVILIGLAIITWRHRTGPAARAFVAAILALLIWTVGNIFGLLALQLHAKIFWDNVQFLGITFLPLLWLNMTLYVTERGPLPGLLQRIIIAIAVATNLIAWTNPYHLFRANPQLVTGTLPFPLLNSDYGLWRNWVHLPGFYLILIVSLGLLFITLVQAGPPYRRQYALLILLSMLIPLIPGTLYVLDIAPFHNWNPATSLLGVSGILIALAQLRFHLFDLVPIARATLIENMTDAVIVLDDQDRLLDLNPAAQWLIDVPPDKSIGQPASHVFGRHPELLDFVQGGDAARANILITTRENERHYEVNHTPLLDSKNRAKGHLLVLHDITLHRQSDEALKESRQRLYDIINFLPDATFAIDTQGKVIAWNKAIEQLTGTPQEELLGKGGYAYAIPFYGEARPMLIDLAITGQETIKQYYDYVTIRDTLIVGEAPTPYLHKGRDAYLWGVAGPLFDNTGKQIGAIECIRDITDRKQAEAELRKAEREKALILDSTSEMFTYYDTDLRIQWANKAAGDSVGLPVEALLGRRCYEVWQRRAEPCMECPVKKAMETHKPQEAEISTPDGRTWLLRGYSVLDEHETVIGLIEFGQDITTRKQTEQAVQKSEERLRLVMEATSDGVWDWNLKTGEAYFSDRYYTMLGYEPREFEASYENWRSLLHPDDIVQTEEAIHLHLENKTPEFSLEFRMKNKSGDWQWINGRGKVMERDETGAPIRMVGTHIDISERRQAAEKIRLLAQMLDIAPNSITVHDFQGHFLYANQRTFDLHGYERDEFYALNLPEVDAPESSELIAQRMNLLREQGEAMFEVAHLHKKGHAFPLEVYTKVVEWDDRPAILSIATDVTERKQAEEERERLVSQMLDLAHRMQQVMDTVPEGVLLLDTRECITLANPLGEEYLLILADSRVGDTLTHLGDHPLADFLTSPPQGLWHTAVVNTRHFEVISRPIESSTLNQHWVLVIRDVTQQREIEDHAQRQERLAAVGQLAAGIAHDFNNILAVITLYAKMSLRTPDLPAKLRERLEIIDQQAWRASSLVQQILDFSRRAVLERSPLDLRAFLEELVKLLERTLPEHITLTFFCEPEIYIVNADPTRLQQAFMNLATNARDAMPNGGELHISLKHLHLDEHLPPSAQKLPRELTPGEWIQITLVDTGSGIPESILPHLFEPFHTTKAPGQGTGLGLSQVYGIIRQHEGYIDVHTEPDKGTTFFLYLPALIAPASESHPLPMEHLCAGQGQVILIVEDNPAARQALAQTLQLLNYRTLEAANGRQALQILTQQDPAQAAEDRVALVLSDVVMPEMGGLALFQTLKERGMEMKVILLTGHPMGKELESLEAQGLNGWLLKPPDIDGLAQAIARALLSEKHLLPGPTKEDNHDESA